MYSQTNNEKEILTPVTLPCVSKIQSAYIKLVRNDCGFYFVTEFHNISYVLKMAIILSHFGLASYVYNTVF
jgi:hypothetical protein